MTEIEEATKPKKCEACGEEFGCGAESGRCWCFDIEPDPKTLQKLAEGYSDCLCPKCLAAAVQPVAG